MAKSKPFTPVKAKPKATVKTKAKATTKPDNGIKAKAKVVAGSGKGGDDLAALVARIASALERLAPPATSAPDFASADAFVWHAAERELSPVASVNRVDMALAEGYRPGSATPCSKTPSGLPMVFRPIMPCSGAHGVWANPRW